MDNFDKLMDCSLGQLDSIMHFVNERNTYDDVITVIDNMSPYELLDAYLDYEGIIGYTGKILELVYTLYNLYESEEDL